MRILKSNEKMGFVKGNFIDLITKKIDKYWLTQQLLKNYN